MKETESEDEILKKQNFIWNLFKKSVELKENKADSDLQVEFLTRNLIYLYFDSLFFFLFFFLFLLLLSLLIKNARNGV
jgi:hypothetical protein